MDEETEEPQRTSDRERHAQIEKIVPIDKLSLRKNITAKPVGVVPTVVPQNIPKNSTKEPERKQTTVKNYVCDNCKVCDEESITDFFFQLLLLLL